MTPEKAHAELSASGSEIWLNCPGSVALARKAPPKVESDYAKEGTTAHELMEKWLSNAIGKWSGRFNVGTTIPKGYSPAMVNAVRFCLFETAKHWTPKKELLIEEEVSLEFIGPDMFGTVDIALVEEFGRLDVIDYKHGSGVKVDIYKETATGLKSLNTQLVYYALGLAHKYHFNFKAVRLAIIQPRYSGVPPVSEVTVSMKDLMAYIDLFKRGVERTMKKDARRHPGPWCRFCKAKPICKESAQGYRTPSREDFGEIA